MTNQEPKNIINWLDSLSDQIESLNKSKKEAKKSLNEARLQYSLLEPTIQTELSLLELEHLDINYPSFEVESSRVSSEQKFLKSQLFSIRESLSSLSQQLISLDCDLEIITTRYN